MSGSTPGAADDERTQLVVGRLGRAVGLRGEVSVEARTDDAEGRFAVGAVLDTDPDRGPLTLRSARQHQRRWVLGFDGVTDREDAEALRDVLLVLDVSDEEPEPDAWFPHQLEGLRVQDTAGADLGSVLRVDAGAAQDLLVVRTAAGDVLVPFVAALVPVVDVPGGRVVVDPPGGMFDGTGAV